MISGESFSVLCENRYGFYGKRRNLDFGETLHGFRCILKDPILPESIINLKTESSEMNATSTIKETAPNQIF